MILVKPRYDIFSIMAYPEKMTEGQDAQGPLRLIEAAGRTCYKSTDKITQDSHHKFVRMLVSRKHEAMIEHSAMTVKFITDRGVSHEFVRHRLCSFAQESTRYCNYKGGVTFVIPPWYNEIEIGEYKTGELPEYKDPCAMVWFSAMMLAEAFYIRMLELGHSPEQARDVLPSSTKTELVVTANFREWKHIFNLRTSSQTHPQFRELITPLRDLMVKTYPEIFERIVETPTVENNCENKILKVRS